MSERNDPCPCGSGKKFKKCCLHKAAAAVSAATAPSTAEINALVSLFRSGHYVELERRTHALLQRFPAAGILWKLLGGARHMQGKSAVAELERAAMFLADDAETHFNYGAALKSTRQYDLAAASYRRAISLKPDYFEAHNNLGSVLKELGQMDDAVRSYRQALTLNPNDPLALANVFTCEHYTGVQNAEQRFAAALRYGELVARNARPYSSWYNAPDPSRRINIGLVSGDLCRHVVGRMLYPVLHALAGRGANAMAFFAYSNSVESDELSERIKADCRGWRSVSGLPDASLAAQIRADGIDILIDLSGHTARNRLPVFAWRPAPVQVSWLGYFATTGVAAIDYLIADPWTLPDRAEKYFSEKIWRLPETRFCFPPPAAEIEVAPLPALASGCVTFGCFNNLGKINRQTIALWSRILRAVPDSRIVIKAKQLSEPNARRHLRDSFVAHGVDAEQIVIEGDDEPAKYFATYHRVDIALDPFPYPGGVTTVDALWMGVPVLTLAGEDFLSRQGVGLLANAGLQDWIASDENDYVERAGTHARDLAALATLRQRLRRQVQESPVIDAQRFSRHFETALREMWRIWCQGRV